MQQKIQEEMELQIRLEMAQENKNNDDDNDDDSKSEDSLMSEFTEISNFSKSNLHSLRDIVTFY